MGHANAARTAPAQLWDVKDVANALKVSQRLVRLLLKTGRLEGYRIGDKHSRWRIPDEAYQRFLERAGTRSLVRALAPRVSEPTWYERRRAESADE